MPTPLKFHLDENVTHDVARGLRLRGIDVTTTAEVGLVTATDDEQFAYARREQRALVTRDTDFLRMAQQGVSHHGIFYWNPYDRDLGEVVNALALFFRIMSAEEMQNRIEYL